MAETIREIAVPVPSGAPMRKDQPGATASQFYPLNAIKSGLEASRKDLERVRAIGAKLNTDVAALNTRGQYAPSYIAEQTAKLRQAASQQAQEYLMAQKTTARLENISRQEHHWTTPKYLGRVTNAGDLGLEKFDTEGNAVKLQKAMLQQLQHHSLLLSLSMQDTDGLSAVGDEASEAGNWPTLAAVVRALSGRAEGGNETARRARQRLEGVEVPDVREALELLEESRKIAQWLDSGLRSITTGEDDVSLRVAQYIEMQNARTAQQQEQQKMEADAAALSDLRRRTG